MKSPIKIAPRPDKARNPWLWLLPWICLSAAGCATVDNLKSSVGDLLNKDEAADDALATPANLAGTTPEPQGDQLVRQIQQQLTRLGYQPGPVTGVMTPRTEASIQDFQLDQDLKIDGKASENLLDMLSAAAASL